MTARASLRFFTARVFTARAATLAALAALAACSSGAGGAAEGHGTEGATATSTEALGSPASRADRDRIREIEDHRRLGDASLRAYLHSGDASVAEAAAVAVGRIGDPSLEADVIAILDSSHATVRAAAAFALGLLPGADAENALVARLGKEHDTDARCAILASLGHVGSATSLALVTAAITGKGESAVHAAAAEAYATLVRSGVAPSSDAALTARLLAFAGGEPDTRAIAAAFALSAIAAKGVAVPEAELIATFHGAGPGSARAYLGRALASVNTATATQALADGVSGDAEARVRADACRFLATTGASAVVTGALTAALRDRASQVVVAAATALGTLGAEAASAVPALIAAYDASRSAWVRSTILPVLVGLDPAQARARVDAGMNEAWPVRLAAIAALAVLATPADVGTLTAVAGQKDVRSASAAIEAIATLDPAVVTPAVKDGLRAALATKDWEIVAAVADASVAFGWADFAADLSALYDAFPGQGAMNGRIEILYALGTIGSTADLPLLQRGLADDEVLVAQTAAGAYQQLTGTDVSAQVPAESTVRTATPSHRAVERALASVVVLETTRGTIALRMLPEAPLSATNFVGLAARGFYDGLPFHRVVPNFVAQGGDPRGDGYGGSDQLVREEISRVPHRRGTVGMATEGKDTGSSQFFFNDGWNVSLDGRYTVFAEVVWGMEAADRLEVGDTIHSARVL